MKSFFPHGGRSRRLLVLVVAVWGLLFGRLGFSEEPPTYFIYQGQKKALTLDPETVAVRYTAAAAQAFAQTAALPAGLTRNGFTATDVTARRMGTWALLKTATARTTSVSAKAAAASGASNPAQVAALLTGLLAEGDPSIEFVSPVFRDDRGGALIVTERLLVGFAATTAAGDRIKAANSVAEGITREKVTFPTDNEERWLVSSKSGYTVLARANELALRPGIAYAEPDMSFTGYTNLVPNDPSFAQSWGLKNTGQSGGLAGFDMGAAAAWDYTTGDPSIIVLIMDSGVQSTHPDINWGYGKDFTTDAASNPKGDPFGTYDDHGTAVAGCVAGKINNGQGSAGIAPSVLIASARCGTDYAEDGSFDASYSWFADALNWASSLGARVSNNSNEFGGVSSAVERAYASTRAAGMVHFAAAGNGGKSSIAYPASVAGVNSVAAADRKGARSSFSQYGAGLKFTAPGEEIYTTDRTGTSGYATGSYSTVDGTSFASPYAAGVAALILSQNSSLTAAQVESRLQATCTDLGAAGYDTNYGWGLVNAAAALAAGAQPNLTSILPSGWSDKVVISSVPGTNTDNSPLYTSDTLYLDYAITNSGLADVAAPFTVTLSVDGAIMATLPHSATLATGDSYTGLDVNLGSLAAGNHTILLTIDSGGAIAETNENDNTYSRTITIASLPNLVPFKPAAWSDKIVVSNRTGTNTDDVITPGTPAYVDFAVQNSGLGAANAQFGCQVFVDGTLKTTVQSGATLAAGATFTSLDLAIGALAAGSHTVQVKVDSANAVKETNESDNSYTKTFSVIAPPSIDTEPTDTTVVYGVTATLTVAASGTGLTYQWYQGPAGTTTTPVGSPTASYTTPALAATTSYWVMVSNGAGSVNSSTATVTVIFTPTITTQPASTVTNTGHTVTLGVVASGSGLSYQWYEGVSGIESTPVASTSASFTTPALSANDSYWVKVNNSAGFINSNTASVTVQTAPLVTAIQGGGNYLSPGSSTIYGQINYPAGAAFSSLRWRPELPAGWSLSSAAGDGSPAIVNGEIVLTGALPNPANFTYTATVPASQTGFFDIGGQLSYALNNHSAATVRVSPDPLSAGPAGYHSSDVDRNGVINDVELSRVLDYWRAQAFHVDATQPDKFAAGAGPTSLPYLSADYLEPHWQLTGPEINRVLAYWRLAGYHQDNTQPDGFFPGAADAQAGGGGGSAAAAHSAPQVYLAGTSLSVSTTFTYTGTLAALAWQAVLPTGWKITSVTGDGAPELQGNDIVWTSATLPPSPVAMSYTVSIPAAAAGSQTVQSKVNYFIAGGSFVDLNASNDPLVLLDGPRSSLELHAQPATDGTVTQNPAPDSDGKYGPGRVITLTAVPSTGYHFTTWSGDATSTANPLQVTTGNDKSLTANFALNVYSLAYGADANGAITGLTSQSVPYGASGSPVTAMANSGFEFVDWSDGSTANPRTDANVTADLSVTARFAVKRFQLKTATLPVGAGTVIAAPAADAQGKYPLGTVVTLTATATGGYLFNSWTGTAGGISNILQVTMGGDQSVTANFTPHPLIKAANYYGLIQGTQTPLLHEQNGYVTVSVTRTGVFTLSALVGGVSKRIKGRFDSTGSSATLSVVNRRSPLYSVNIHLDPDDSLGLLTGDVKFATGATSALIARRNDYNKHTNPAPKAGRYTFMSLPSSSETGDTEKPQGTGAGVLVVNTGGVVTLVETLPDGTAFSRRTAMASDGTWPLYGLLNRGRGFITGWMNFKEVDRVSDGAGSLTWIKPAVARTYFPKGFTTKCDALVSKYTYARNVIPITFAAAASNATFTVQDGEVNPLPDPRVLTLLANGHLTQMVQDRFTMSIKVKTGLFSGRFPEPQTGLLHKFQGVLFQKQDLGAGFYRGMTETGGVMFQASR